MQIDVSQDYLMHFDNPEPVTLTALGAATNSTWDTCTTNWDDAGWSWDGPIEQSIAIPIAQQGTLTRRELAASYGVWTPKDIWWLIPAVTIAPLVPGERWRITDQGGTVWTIIDVSRSSLGSSVAWFKCTCRNMVLAHGLADSIDIQQCVTSVDAAGAVVRAWPTDPSPGGLVLYSGLACRAQSVSQDVAEEFGVRAEEGSYLFILSQQVDLDTSLCRVVFGGLVMDIVRLTNSEKTDDLPLLECRLRP